MKFHSLAILGLLSVILVMGVEADTDTPIGGDIGTYRVHCNVEGARVYFGGDFKGNITSGTLDVPVYSTGTPYRSLSIEKEGYYPYYGQINSVPAKGAVVNIYATMSAMPPVEYATLHLLVTPSLSSVSLDGSLVGEVPENGILIVRDVLPGAHLVQVTKPGYMPSTQDIRIEKNEVKKVSIALVARKDGSLSVLSDPSGAEVILDGQPVGVTPALLSGINRGDHTVVLKKDGYNNFTSIVSVSGAEATLNATLAPSLPGGGNSIGIFPFTIVASLFFLILTFALKRQDH